MAVHGPIVHPATSCFSPVSFGESPVGLPCFPAVPLTENAFPLSIPQSLSPELSGLIDGELHDGREAGASEKALEKVLFELGGDG